MHLRLISFASSLFLGHAAAVASVSANNMTAWLSAGGVELALAAQPMWFFGQTLGNPPCYPTAALDSDNDQVPSGNLCFWPNSGCNCRNPDVPVGNAGPSFPVYFSFKQCTDKEIRVAYNVFYEKDGFRPAFLGGHAYDWERVIVLWTLSDDGYWETSQLMLSQHMGYQTLDWEDIQNTLDTEDAPLERGGDDGRTNLDHAKVYVAWSKHAHYNTRNTDFRSPWTQLFSIAFRSDDWWYFPVSDDYILSDDSTDVGRLLGSLSWGNADSNPLVVHEGLCSAS